MIKSKYRHIYIAIALCGAGILLRLLYLFQFSESPLFATPLGPDVQEYDLWAKNIISGELLWGKVHIHAPIYPYFLALLYKITSFNFFSIRFIQLILGFLPAFLLCFLLRRENKTSLIPTLFLAFWTLYTPLIYYQAEITSESLLLPALCLTIFLLYSAENKNNLLYTNIGFSLAGIASGIAILIHPFCTIFVACEVVYIALSGGLHVTRKTCLAKAVQVSLFVLFTAITLTPIVIYNSVLEKRIIFVQKNAGFNFFIGNSELADGTCCVRPGLKWDEIHKDATANQAQTGISTDLYFLKKSAFFIIEHPFKWASLLLKKTIYTWNFRELTAGADTYYLKYFTPLQRSTWWFFGAVGALALTGFALSITDRDFLYRNRHFVILLFASCFAQVIFTTSGRYRLAMLPAIFLFAAYMIDKIAYAIRHKKRVTAICLLLILSLAIVFIPKPPSRIESEKGESETIIAEAYMQKGMPDKAMTHLLNAIKLNPKWHRNYNLLGKIYLDNGELAKAETTFLKCRNLAPSSYYAYMNLGTLMSIKGENLKAENYFKQALDLAPVNTPNLYYNIAYYNHKTSNHNVANRYYKLCLKAMPSHTMALNSLAGLKLLNREYQPAIELFRKSLTLQSDNHRIMTNLAYAYILAGRRDKALPLLKKSLEIAPEYQPTIILLKNQNIQ